MISRLATRQYMLWAAGFRDVANTFVETEQESPDVVCTAAGGGVRGADDDPCCAAGRRVPASCKHWRQ